MTSVLWYLLGCIQKLKQDEREEEYENSQADKGGELTEQQRGESEHAKGNEVNPSHKRGHGGNE